jgi:ATP-dependent Clp protease ATP-binding subunit ClpB
MSALVSPKFGFGANEQVEQIQSGAANTDLDDRIALAGLAAARRRFTPEFINRLDKIVTFKPLRSD